jgi:RNA polymerase sigma factor (TIGR02999 family)
MSQPSLESQGTKDGALPFSAADLAEIYRELRKMAAGKMARERPSHTLQPTALVHEAWLRIGGRERFVNRAHFFGAAAEAMRRILVEHARRKLAQRHGGGQERVDVEEVEIAAPAGTAEHLLEVHEALDGLAAEDARKAELVKLCFFAGFALKEAAVLLGISERTAKRDWITARAWLAAAIGGTASE